MRQAVKLRPLLAVRKNQQAAHPRRVVKKALRVQQVATRVRPWMILAVTGIRSSNSDS